MIKKIIIVGLYHLMVTHPTYCADLSNNKIWRPKKEAIRKSAIRVWRAKNSSQEMKPSLVWRQKSTSNVLSNSSKTLIPEPHQIDSKHQCPLDQLIQQSFSRIMRSDLSISAHRDSSSQCIQESFSDEEWLSDASDTSTVRKAIEDSFSGDEEEIT